MKRHWMIGLAWLGAALSVACSSGGDVVDNPGVERWCDAHPCEWEVSGTVKRVPSWHPDDYAVELVSDDAQLSQLNAAIDSSRSDCFSFGLIADIDRGARAFLELDFLDDGTVEFSQQLPPSNWDRLTFKIRTPAWYQGVRFIVRKDGPGKVIVAELSAQNAKGKCSTPPIQLQHRPAGAVCDRDDDCADAPCIGGRCGGCGSGAGACAAGSVCGLVLSGGMQLTCVPEASSPFGAACKDGSQCESGFCQNHACSECSGASCDDGRACVPAQPALAADFWPSVCAAGSGERLPGELCTEDEDCASGDCVNAKVDCVPCAAADPGCSDGCIQQLSGGHCQ